MPTASRSRPGEERQDRSGSSLCVAIIQVIASRIVEIDGHFDKTQPQQPAVEIDVLLSITRDGGDVMNTQDRPCHVVICSNSRRCENSSASIENAPGPSSTIARLATR